MAISNKKRPTKRKKFNLINFFVTKGKLRVGHTLILIVGLFIVGIIATSYAQKADVATNNQGVVFQNRQKWLASMVPYAQELQRKYGVLASITLAQAAHESNWNNSELSTKYHNFYGVKAGPGQNSISLPTNEYVRGQKIVVNAPFRVYPNWQASMLDHTLLLVHGTLDNHQRYHKVITAPNYMVAANELGHAGYATDPLYAQKLIKIIELYHLNRFDYR